MSKNSSKQPEPSSDYDYLPSGGVVPSLQSTDPSKNPPFRVSSAAQARAIQINALSADFESQRNRVLVQAELDGQPPWNARDLAAVGQQYRTNCNFRFMSAAFTQVMAAVRDAVESNVTLIQVKTAYGSKAVQSQYNDSLSRNITKMVKDDWSEFSDQSSRLHRNWAWMGFGQAYFEDDLTWTYETAGLNEFTYPRETYANERKVEIVFATRMLHSHELNRYIQDEKVAEELGWDVDAVKDVLVNFPRNMDQGLRVLEQTERMMKNNDFTLNDQIGTTIPITHMWVQEFDGSVTHAIFFSNASFNKSPLSGNSSEDGSSGLSQFLYWKPKEYDSMERAFVLFPYDHGTNGYIHSLRGIGYDILPHTSAMNRLYSQGVDCAFQNLSNVVSAENESVAVEAAITPCGSFTFLRPGFKLETNTTVNVALAAGSMLDLLNKDVSKRIGGIDNEQEQTSNRTELEAAIKLGNLTRLNASDLEDLFRKYSVLYREVVRRVKEFVKKPKLIQEQTKGYREIQILLRRLEEDGTPIEALFGIIDEETRAIPALGFGSSTQRKIALNNSLKLSPYFDKKGRDFLLHTILRAEIGEDYANQILPFPNTERKEASQEGVAALQNDVMSIGRKSAVYSNEDHETHASVHAGLLLDLIAQSKQGKEQLAQVTPVLQLLVPHFSEHLSFMAPYASEVQEYSSYKELASQANEPLTNGTRLLQSLQREQEKKQAQATPEGGEGEEANLTQVKLQGELQKQQLEKQKSEMEMQLKKQESDQRMALKQADVASNILK